MDRPDNSPAAAHARLPDHMADAGAAKTIVELMDLVDRKNTQMAVVDCIGFCFQNARGQIVQIDQYTPDRIRYEARSMAHVAVYGFTVLHYNPAAMDAIQSVR
jgi:hypothetical protein